MDNAEKEPGGRISWAGAGRAIRRNSIILRGIGLVAFVCLAIAFSTAGVYLRSYELQFKIQELKDYILISNQPDSECAGSSSNEWIYGALESFLGCDARQREDFTHSDKELFDQCVSTHEFEREEHCQRGKEIRILIFNLTNPEDVLEGLTPRMVEIGRKRDGGPLVFYEDCKTFDTEFGPREVHFSEHCYYTYKYADTEEEDLHRQIVTVNVGLMEAIGNSDKMIDYIIPVVWGTLALDVLNATTTTAEDFIRGQLLSFSWPNNFGAHFLGEFSPKPNKAGFLARDNARRLFEMVLDPLQEFCMVNGTRYDRNQCISMANSLAMFARRYYESFQTFNVMPYMLTYKQGAGLFVQAKIGDLLGYYSGHDDPLSAYLYPKKVSWGVVRSKTQVEVNAEIQAGMADSQNGLLNPGPMGRSSILVNTVEELGSYTEYQGRKFILEFDWQGCRPLAPNGEVVVAQDGPFPPQCNGGNPQRVSGSAGSYVKPRVWSIQSGVDEADHIRLFSKTLKRPLKYSAVESLELQAEENEFIKVRRFELLDEGLREARFAFNCEEVYRRMAEAGVVNRGSDCEMHQGMMDLSAAFHQIPYVWSLPHFYRVTATDDSQHPRNGLTGILTPTGPWFQSTVVVEPDSGRIVQSMIKEQISIRLYHHSQNYFFTKHKPVTIPLFWKFETKNATVSERQMMSGFQSTFQGLNAGFIACVVLGAVSLITALAIGMLLYRDNSLQSVVEKRKKIQAELQGAVPPDEHVDEDVDGEEQGFL